MFTSLGRRSKRIDRALSHVLDAIQERHAYYLQFCETWNDCDNLAIETEGFKLNALRQAKRLHAQWDARIAAMGDD